MEWEDIIPQRGIRIKQSPGVTVALRLPEGGRPHISVNVGRELRDALGWRPKQRVRVQRNSAAGLVRLSLTEDAAIGYSLHGAASDTCISANFPLPDLPAERRKAEGVENRIEGEALIFALPEWARGAVQEPQPTPAAPAFVPQTFASATASATVSDRIKAGIAAARQAREAGVPLPASPGSGKASKLHAPTDADAAIPDARDRLEAMAQLRRGRSVRDVAKEFGFKIDAVAGWHDEILAERVKGRAA